MAQRTQVILTDDLDGTELGTTKGETVTFALDGATFEIDLSSKNASALRKSLAPYVGAARRVGRATKKRSSRAQPGADARTIKEWARAHGYEVSDRGRISNDVRAAFDAANR